MTKRIFGFTWTNCNGQKVAMYERDFYTRKAFMDERRRLKAQGINLTDLKTDKPQEAKKVASKTTTTKSGKAPAKKKSTTGKATTTTKKKPVDKKAPTGTKKKVVGKKTTTTKKKTSSKTKKR